MVLTFKNLFKPNSPQQMQEAGQKVEAALLNLDASPIDAQIKEMLWERYRE